MGFFYPLGLGSTDTLEHLGKGIVHDTLPILFFERLQKLKFKLSKQTIWEIKQNPILMALLRS